MENVNDRVYVESGLPKLREKAAVKLMSSSIACCSAARGDCVYC